MRCSAPRHTAWDVLVVGGWKDVCGRIAVRNDDRGAIVTSTNLHAGSVDMFRPAKMVLADISHLRRLRARGMTGWTLVLNVVGHDSVVHQGCIFARSPRVAVGRGLALRLVRIEQPLAAPTLQ